MISGNISNMYRPNFNKANNYRPNFGAADDKPEGASVRKNKEDADVAFVKAACKFSAILSGLLASSATLALAVIYGIYSDDKDKALMQEFGQAIEDSNIQVDRVDVKDYDGDKNPEIIVHGKNGEAIAFDLFGKKIEKLEEYTKTDYKVVE